MKTFKGKQENKGVAFIPRSNDNDKKANNSNL